jgi:hypothetical protein
VNANAAAKAARRVEPRAASGHAPEVA